MNPIIVDGKTYDGERAGVIWLGGENPTLRGHDATVEACERLRGLVLVGMESVGLVHNRQFIGVDPFADPESMLAVVFRFIDPETARVTGYRLPTWTVPNGADS